MLTVAQQKLVINGLAVVGAIHTYQVVKTRLAATSARVRKS